MVAVIRIADTGASAWEEQGEYFVRALGNSPTVAELHDRLRSEGFEVFVENCLFPDCERQAAAVPRYRYVEYCGAGGAGAGRHLVRVN